MRSGMYPREITARGEMLPTLNRKHLKQQAEGSPAENFTGVAGHAEGCVFHNQNGASSSTGESSSNIPPEHLLHLSCVAAFHHGIACLRWATAGLRSSCVHMIRAANETNKTIAPPLFTGIDEQILLPTFQNVRRSCRLPLHMKPEIPLHVRRVLS